MNVECPWMLQRTGHSSYSYLFILTQWWRIKSCRIVHFQKDPLCKTQLHRCWVITSSSCSSVSAFVLSFCGCLCITVQMDCLTLATSGLLDGLSGKIMMAIWKAECVERIACLQLELELKSAKQEPARTDRCLKSVKAWNAQMNAEWVTVWSVI